MYKWVQMILTPQGVGVGKPSHRHAVPLGRCQNTPGHLIQQKPGCALLVIGPLGPMQTFLPVYGVI